MTIPTIGIIFVMNQVILGPVGVQSLTRESRAFRSGSVHSMAIHNILAMAIIRILIHLLRLGQMGTECD